MTVGEWLAKAERLFRDQEVPEPSANAEFLMAAVLKGGRNAARANAGLALTDKQGSQYWGLVRERGRRIPLAYVLGSQPFMGLDIQVTREVLIPRPETEEVVSEAIRLFKGREAEPLRLLEIGTGSGCIAVALSVRFPNAMVYATDFSPTALSLAMKNAEAHHRGRNIRFIREDMFKASASLRGWVDLVISNPPYIPTAEIPRLEAEVQKEPRLALDGGKDGLDAIRAVVADAPKHLKPGGRLVLEIGAGQGAAVLKLLESAGLEETAVRKDLQGHERIAVGKMVE